MLFSLYTNDCTSKDPYVELLKCAVGSATKSVIRRLQRMVRTAESMIGAPLPTLQELYTFRVRKMAQKITLDPSHPSHLLFELLQSGRCYRAPNTRTARHKNSFFPQAIYLINSKMFSHCAKKVCAITLYLFITIHPSTSLQLFLYSFPILFYL